MLNMESVDPKINTLLWLCNMKKKMTVILKIKEGTRRRAQTNWKGTFHWWVCNFGDHVLCRLAFSLSNVIRQVGRQMKIPAQVHDFFLEFGIWHSITMVQLSSKITFARVPDLSCTRSRCVPHLAKKGKSRCSFFTRFCACMDASHARSGCVSCVS